MNRRAFLKFLFAGTSALLMRQFFPFKLRAQGSDEEEYDLYDIYSGMSRRIGGETVENLDNSSRARNMRQDANRVMEESGFRLNRWGDVVEDTTNLSDLPRSQKMLHSEYSVPTECYPMRIDPSYYRYNLIFVPMPDICVPWFIDYQDVVFFEGPAVLAVGYAVAFYAFDHYGAETSSELSSHQKGVVANYFMPSASVRNADSGQGGTFASTDRKTTIYKNLVGGDVEIEYTPPPNDDGRGATVEIRSENANGGVVLEEELEFDITS